MMIEDIMHIKIEDLENFPETTVIKTHLKTTIDVMADDGHVIVTIKGRSKKQPKASPEERCRRDEAILQLLMTSDMTQNEIAKIFGISQTYVSQLKSKKLK
jgi:DNA-directed RNA polymerase specialized sigma subunit